MIEQTPLEKALNTLYYFAVIGANHVNTGRELARQEVAESHREIMKAVLKAE